MSNNDLTFLVQLNSGPPAGKDKAVINAHVSRRAHSRRKQLAQQASIDPYQTLSVLPLPISGHTTTTEKSANVFVDALDDEQTLSPTSPLTVIGGGNSDPFDALQYRIDPQAHRYLTFGRDVLEIAIHGAGWRGWVGSTFLQKQYVGPDLITGHNILAVTSRLEHPVWSMVIIYGVLAYCASGVAAITADAGARQDALEYATEGMKCMRRHLDDVNRDVDRISEELVYRLFRAEVLAENHASALIHGQLLKVVLEHKSKRSGLRLDILSNALYQNGHWMFSSWTKSIFDSKWIAEQYQLVWSAVDNTFEGEIDFEERDLNICITDQHLRKLSLLTKRLFLQSRMGIVQQRQAPLEQHYSQATKCEWLQLMWMEYYLHSEGIKPDKDDDIALEHEVDMCLALSTLYVLRHAKNDPYVNGRPLFRGSTRIFQKLYARLRVLCARNINCILERRKSSLVYVFYVSAVAATHARGVPGEQDKASSSYQMLKQHLMHIGIDNWHDLVALLETFPFVEEELPQPYPGWYDGLFETG